MERSKVRLCLIGDDGDDEFVVRRRIAQIAPFSFEVDRARSIEQGILSLARHEHDICLLDMDLLIKKNLDLAAVLRVPGESVPIIILRGRATREVNVMPAESLIDVLDKEDLDTPLFDRVVRYAIERGRMATQLREVQERVRALSDANSEGPRDRTAQARMMLSDRLASVGTLAAGISHEINNPLAYVLSNVSFAKDELLRLGADAGKNPPPLSNEARVRIAQVLDALADAYQGAERVQSIVRDLRSFSRAEEDRRGPVDVHRVLEVAITVARAEVRRRAQLVTEYDKDLPEIDANEGRLAQVFINVLINAAQAIPEGNPRDETVRIVTREGEHRRVVVEISDSGVGMAPDVRARAFDPFFTTKPIGVGTGLGLFVCHSIVSSLGGVIAVDSMPGHGTTFRLEFPSRASQAMKLAPVIRASSTRRGHLLIVDDEPLVCSSLKRSLTRDYEVKAVHSARAALELIEGGEHFDLILCDLMMPEMSGMDLYHELGREHVLERDRMVFFTGGAFTTGAREFLNAVPNARLEKPADIGQIRELLRQRLAS